MIKYKLICKNCDLSFDSWFASSREFEKLKKKDYLNCHNCNSKKVEKSLMAPKMISSSEININDRKNLDFKKINKKIKEYQKFIKKNFDYLGENFAFEANPRHCYEINKKKLPFGVHAWEKWDKKFWIDIINKNLNI